MKRCSRCKEEKPLSDFSSKGKDNYCKPCRSIKNAEYREKFNKNYHITYKRADNPYVYAFIENDKIVRVGSSILKPKYRCRNYIYQANVVELSSSYNSPCSKWIREKLKINNLKQLDELLSMFTILEYVPEGGDKLLKTEQHYIDKYNPIYNVDKSYHKNWELVEMNLKKCSTCKEILPLTEYSKHKNYRGGTKGECKSCSYKRYKEYYQKNKERITEYQREYRRKNKISKK